MPPANPSVRDVETRLNDLERDFVEFRGEGRIMFTAARWLTALALISFLGGFYQIMAVVQAATRMQVQGEQNSAEIKRIDERLGRLEGRVEALEKRVERIEAKIDALTDLVRQALAKPAGAAP